MKKLDIIVYCYLTITVLIKLVPSVAARTLVLYLIRRSHPECVGAMSEDQPPSHPTYIEASPVHPLFPNHPKLPSRSFTYPPLAPPGVRPF